MLIALAGLPGAGKSTLAKGLQASLRCEVVSRDTIRMNEFPDWDDRAAKRAAFEILRLEVSVLLKAGATVVVDGATLATVAERQALRGVAAALGRPFLLLWLDAPAAQAAARIAADRGESPSDRRPGLAHDVAARFEAPGAHECCHRLDASLPSSEVLAAARDAIRGTT